jgi:uncharacterized protein (TIGR03437 family)
MRSLKVALFLCVAAAGPLAAQTPVFDTSGNGMLNGTYYFRHVYYLIGTNPDNFGITGDITGAIALYGNITFNGSGAYTINNGFVFDPGFSSQPDPLSCYIAQTTCAANAGAAVNSTYSISASGFGFLVDPLNVGVYIYGLVAANGIFSGSSTEAEVAGAFTDLFIGAPLASPVPTGFKGSYNVVGFLPGEDLSFQMNPNGAGSLGTVNISGYSEFTTTGTASQSSPATYTFSNGAAVLSFPTSTTAPFFSGQEYLYFSPDGNFFFGGSPTGLDMIAGVNNASSDQSFGTCIGGSSCLFYQAGIDQDLAQIGNGYSLPDGYYGSFNATSAGNIIAHERFADVEYSVSTYGFTFADSFTTPVTGSYVDNSYQFNYWVGDGGTVRIGEGIGPFLGLTVAFQAPSFTPPSGGVYLNPTGIVNSAGFAPFTAGVSNGEFLSLFGNNLATGTASASSLPFPIKLGGAQVMVNGVPAPIYYASPTQINIISPYGNPVALPQYEQFQVINSIGSSNVVTETVSQTTPGVFIDGQGYAAALHNADFSLVSPANPAQPCDNPPACDYIDVFMSGLGSVYPAVADGYGPPAGTQVNTNNTIAADIGGVTATVAFAGLSPDAGLYQVSLSIPSSSALSSGGVTAGDNFLDISGLTPPSTTTPTPVLESYAQQAVISIGTDAGALPSARRAETSLRRGARSAKAPDVQRNRRCFFGGKTTCAAQRILPLPNARVSEP